MVRITQKETVNCGYASKGERVIVSAGVPFGRAGTTNLLRIVTIGENGKA
jgi:pyruvate kinase